MGSPPASPKEGVTPLGAPGWCSPKPKGPFSVPGSTRGSLAFAPSCALVFSIPGRFRVKPLPELRGAGTSPVRTAAPGAGWGRLRAEPGMLEALGAAPPRRPCSGKPGRARGAAEPGSAHAGVNPGRAAVPQPGPFPCPQLPFELCSPSTRNRCSFGCGRGLSPDVTAWHRPCQPSCSEGAVTSFRAAFPPSRGSSLSPQTPSSIPGGQRAL